MKEKAFMPQINLEEEDLKKLFEAVNEGYEPPGDLIAKLFPSFFEKLKQDSKFDFKELIHHKIPTLEYAGKRQEGVILASASILGQSAPLQVVRSFGEPGEDGWRNMIVQGDNLQFLKTVFLNQDPLIKDKVKGKVKLIYIDPPFATKSDFQSKEGATSYSDKVESAEFLENLRERLIFLREILAEDGSIYVHLDWKKGHYVKVLMDQIFGEENFQNDIIYNFGKFRYSKERWKRDYVNILFYTKNPAHWIFNCEDVLDPYLAKTDRRFDKTDEEGRRYKYLKGRKIYMQEGTVPSSVWRMSNLQDNSQENTWYPTQKTEELLTKIVRASSSPSDLVMDVFGGSGTAAAVAEKLGRRWIMCDFGKHAIYTMQRRLLNIDESKALGNEKKDKKYGVPPKPFCVVSAGAYDFTRVMNLRKNKDAYISFVLALFGIPREDKDFVSKYRLDGIYAEKDGDPVEIFPVWDDDYLYHVKVDQEYLKEIIIQSRGRIKGYFYIIVPETCTVISDMTLPNNSGDVVHFKLLKFPYKILEEIARNFDIEEQPDSPSNINNLVSSVGFYFNDEIVIKVQKEDVGFRLTTFKTMIVNREGKMYEGFDGLSLILIDLDYDGKVFKLDKAVYAKEIKEDGFIAVEGLRDRTAIIAIDKHGNESKPTYITG
jgi:DNA modification methylase